jgi:glutathione S-transferase
MIATKFLSSSFPMTLAYSPNVPAPTVPTLQLENGQGLPDSFAIAEYLEEKYPDRPSLFGATQAEKNLQRFVESYVQSKIHPSIQRMVFQDMYHMQDDDNAHYFRTSREKSSGRPHAEIAGDRNENLRELKESLGLIHTALKRSGGWILGSHRKLSFFFPFFLLLFSPGHSLFSRFK